MTFNSRVAQMAALILSVEAGKRVHEEAEAALKDAVISGTGRMVMHTPEIQDLPPQDAPPKVIVVDSIVDTDYSKLEECFLASGFEVIRPSGRHLTQNETSQRLTQSHITRLAEEWARSAVSAQPAECTDYLPSDEWHRPKKTVIKQAYKQPFRARMRSVNRNR